MTDLKKLMDERIERLIFTVEASTKKIVKKELNKMRKDILKEMMRNG